MAGTLEDDCRAKDDINKQLDDAKQQLIEKNKQLATLTTNYDALR